MPSGHTTFHVHVAYGDTGQQQDDLLQLTGKTGGLVLIPLAGTCNAARPHKNTELVSPNVILEADPSTWKRRKCSHCRASVLMRPDYERLYGRQP